MAQTNGAKIKSVVHGVYPKWCNKQSNFKSKDFQTILDALFSLLSLDHIDPIQKCIRENLNKYYGIIERNEGFYYGTSKAFEDLVNKNPNFDHKDVVVEHAIPAKILITEANKRVLNGSISNANELYIFLKKHYYICIITKDEDKHLNKAGLKNSMPTSWTGLNDVWTKRYGAVGIGLKTLPGKLP